MCKQGRWMLRQEQAAASHFLSCPVKHAAFYILAKWKLSHAGLPVVSSLAPNHVCWLLLGEKGSVFARGQGLFKKGTVKSSSHMNGVQHIHAKSTQQEGVQLEQAGCERQVGQLALVFGSFCLSITRSIWSGLQTGSSLRIRSVGALIRRISPGETSADRKLQRMVVTSKCFWPPDKWNRIILVWSPLLRPRKRLSSHKSLVLGSAAPSARTAAEAVPNARILWV